MYHHFDLWCCCLMGTPHKKHGYVSTSKENHEQLAEKEQQKQEQEEFKWKRKEERERKKREEKDSSRKKSFRRTDSYRVLRGEEEDFESMEEMVFSSGEQTQGKCTESESEDAALTQHSTRRWRPGCVESQSEGAALIQHSTRRRRPGCVESQSEGATLTQHSTRRWRPGCVESQKGDEGQDVWSHSPRVQHLLSTAPGD